MGLFYDGSSLIATITAIEVRRIFKGIFDTKKKIETAKFLPGIKTLSPQTPYALMLAQPPFQQRWSFN